MWLFCVAWRALARRPLALARPGLARGGLLDTVDAVLRRWRPAAGARIMAPPCPRAPAADDEDASESSSGSMDL